MKPGIHIWLWMQKGRLLKAVTNCEKGTVIYYDEYDHMLIVRSGLTFIQMKKIEERLALAGAKKCDEHQSFSYL